jgi:hypothetical protein
MNPLEQLLKDCDKIIESCKKTEKFCQEHRDNIFQNFDGDIDSKTGKLSRYHIENCSGCALCDQK